MAGEGNNTALPNRETFFWASLLSLISTGLDSFFFASEIKYTVLVKWSMGDGSGCNDRDDDRAPCTQRVPLCVGILYCALIL